MTAQPRLFTRREAEYPGKVYFIGFAEYVKIGYTGGHLCDRLSALQSACPEKLHVYAAFAATPADERTLHDVFKRDRLRGEWFRLTSKIRETIQYFVEHP